MEKNPININNKIKQFFGGNWGKPNNVEQDIDLPNPLFPEPEEVKVKSKKKRHRKPYISPWSVCPFCNEELEKDEEESKKPELRWMGSIGLFPYKQSCNKCGSYKIEKCPACGSCTWYNPNSKIFKHQGKFGCGFEGEKRNES